MFIVFGTKVRRLPVGWIGAFCPVRRELVAFEVADVCRVLHAYHIPVGRGTHQHYELRDPESGLVHAMDESAFQQWLPRRGPVESLAECTNPSAFDELTAASELDDDAIRQAPNHPWGL